MGDGQRPTEDSPELGEVCVGGVTISSASRWIEDDGAHVIRSSEFDLYGEGDDWDEAVDAFLGHAKDFVVHLAELVRAGEATDHEDSVLAELAPRFVEAFAKSTALLEKEVHRLERRRLNLGRRSVHSTPKHWHPQTLKRSTPLSHA